MSEQHDFPKTTPKQVMLATLGGLIAPALVVALIFFMLWRIQSQQLPDDPNQPNPDVEANIAPVAVAELAAEETGPHVDQSGEQVVKAVCVACHAVGALGSPKIGDQAAWAPRISQGYDTLVKHAIQGIRSMPARGGNPNLTDGEIGNAVAYMANQSGASFKTK